MGYWNSTPPLRVDDKSIPCEMNKFADMIKYMAATSDAFEQVIATDLKNELFQRAWVIAEIAQAHTVGLKQHLKLHSIDALTQREDSLKDLKVENMRAARPE